MNAVRFRVLTMVAALLVAFLAPVRAVQSQAGPARFALLPLVPGDRDLPYAVLPTRAERAQLGGKLARDVAQKRGGVPIPPARVALALVRAGIDQESAYRECATAACARRIGRAVHADTVVFGSVTRYMAMIWGTEVSLVDVASGKVEGPYALGYKGDYLALAESVENLAQAVSTQMIADSAARNRSHSLQLTHR